MKIYHLCFLLLFVTIANCYGDGIIVLDQNNFDEVLSQVKHVVVEFYEPGCTTCHEFAHEYAKASQRLSSHSPHIKFFAVDASTEKGLASRYNIKSFPTTRFFIRGSRTPLEYKGPQDAEDIIDWVLENYMRVSVEVNSIQQVQKYTNFDNVVGLFFASPNSLSFEHFLEVARTTEDVVFINSDNDDLRKHFGLEEKKEALILFKRFDEAQNIYDGSMTVGELQKFLNIHKYPAVMMYGRKAEHRIFDQGENAIILFKDKGQDSRLAEEEFRKAAPELKNKFVMTIIDWNEHFEVQLTELFSVPLNRLLVVNKDDLPAIRLFEPGNQIRRFGLNREITTESIKSFARDWDYGRLKPLVISAPIPKNQYDENVKILVGKNFNEEVYDNDHDIVVLSCNTNNFSCRKFENVYNKIAGQLKGDSTLVMAKLDTSVNELVDVKFKTPIDVRIYPKGRKTSPILYEGDLDEQLILQFIRQNAGSIFSNLSSV